MQQVAGSGSAPADTSPADRYGLRSVAVPAVETGQRDREGSATTDRKQARPTSGSRAWA